MEEPFNDIRAVLASGFKSLNNAHYIQEVQQLWAWLQLYCIFFFDLFVNTFKIDSNYRINCIF